MFRNKLEKGSMLMKVVGPLGHLGKKLTRGMSKLVYRNHSSRIENDYILRSSLR
jgi:hypothetical protein